ncbi:hypothetical protein YC2023_061021 [Brassica napus]
MVLNKRPCHFNQWSFALERWEPFTSENFPNTIPFWISVTGIPVHFWNDKTFTEIANALGRKLLIDEKKARIQVSIDADQPLQFERRIGFPNGDMGKVSLTYEGLHRFCFTCKLISHNENTCPQLSPAERELKIKQRAGNHLTNDQTQPHLQDSQAFNSRNTLKRPRFPINGRHSSPLTSSRNNESLQEEKRRKSTPSAHSPREARNLGYQARDLRSSSRQDHNSHQGREVWSRLEIPTRREESRGRTNDRHHSRNLFPYPAPRPRNSSSMEWRPIRNNEDQRNRTSDNRALRHTTINRSERSRATFDSQRTISENRASLESGEIPVSKNRGDATIDATIDAETEEERIRRIKGKAIATDTPAVEPKIYTKYLIVIGV